MWAGTMPRKERRMNYLPMPMILALFVVPPPGEPNVLWNPGFPMSIPGTGSALVSGRARPASGFVLTSATVRYFEDGCAVTTRPLPVKDGVLGPAVISGLTPGKRYEVVIEVMETRGDVTKALETHSYVIAR
jgi:hypothetical protein